MELPDNKKIWTSSYVLLMGGLGMTTFAAFHYLVDVLKVRKAMNALRIVGVNSIAAFVGSVMEIKILVKTNIGSVSLYDWVVAHWFTPPFGPLNGPTFFAASTVLTWWLILYGMYWRGWFLKI